jgi:hypothetical protein
MLGKVPAAGYFFDGCDTYFGHSAEVGNESLSQEVR